MADPLTATSAVTFLFTDIEGSTRLALELGDAWFDVLQAHHRIMRGVIAESGGVEVSTAGDSFFVVFDDPTDAVRGAVAMVRALDAHDWRPHAPVRVRIGMHTGEAIVHDDDYAGIAVHTASRVESAASGAQILVTAATLDALAGLPDGLDVIDLGAHRLKDLPAELRLFQLVADGLERNFPPVRGVATLRNNVPTPVSTFIGRREDLSRLGRSLDRERLVSLVGPGGTGKTRLAIQAASERLHRYPGGVWFVELDAAGGEPTAVAAIASALGLQEERGRSVFDTVVDALRNDEALLVFDNCEHIVDAVARLAERLLRAAPRLHVLTTTREALMIAGEQIFPVSPLAVDADAPGESEAVQLLADRVARVRPDFEIDDEREAAIAIAARLDGLPLALELAAASAATLSLSAIVDQLDARFDLLVRGSRTALDRQKTLWGAIDWSYDLLTSHERTLFRHLAVFPSEFDHETVVGVCAEVAPPSDTIALLGGLVQKSLVAPSGAGRLRLLESIRAYARARLASDQELDAATERHARWFASTFLQGPLPSAWASASDALDLAHDDLAAGLHWAADHDHPLALALLATLQPFWLSRGRWAEGRTRSAHVLESTAIIKAPARVQALARDAELAFVQGDTAGVRERIEEAVELADALGGELTPMVLGNLGVIAEREGDLESAEQMYRRGSEASLAAGSTDELVFASRLAEIARRRGDLDAARSAASAALARARELGQDSLSMKLTTLLADIAHQGSDLDIARGLYEEALAAAQASHDRGQAVYLLFRLGCLALDRNAVDEAAEFLFEAVQLGRDLSSGDDLVESLEATARLAVVRGDRNLARRLLATVDSTREVIEFPRAPIDQAAYENLAREIGGGTDAAPLLALDDAVDEALAFMSGLS
ncbi:MAG TPA: adenylate/guanylate cyclase domain-containing protein [Acidimicrobiia bacterium]|nr:adenylate/guanylate cyclase domain-containing protein [Acidimicrobiia bacterium]